MTGRPTVLVTGASSGIGKAIAELLSVSGYKVFGSSRNPKSDVIDKSFEMVKLDIDSEESVRSCLEEISSKTFGRLDILINNAGVGLFGAIEDTSVDEAKAIFETNFFGVVRLTKGVIPMMRKHAEGKIINVSSSVTIVPAPFNAFYSASKHALEGYTEALRFELASFNIQVALVEPAFFRTEIDKQAKTAMQKLDVYSPSRERVRKHYEDGIANGRDPKIVAEAVLKIMKSKLPELHNYLLANEPTDPKLLGIKKQDRMEAELRRFWEI